MRWNYNFIHGKKIKDMKKEGVIPKGLNFDLLDTPFS
jgi:hypothetical protein